MTASLHKLTAGSGYDYLTRQVAAQDSTEKGHSSLTSYYTEKGEVPGRWVGSGMTALEMTAGSAVSEVQMRSLFGAGFHPDMEARLAALPAGASAEQVRAAGRLGSPFKLLETASRFQQEVAIRCSQWSAANGQDGGGAVPVGVRAQIRNAVATEGFVARMGRLPGGAELSSEVARLTRSPTTACAGYDVTFTPVKSVSALWAVAPTAMAAQIEEAHNAAVADALRFLEERVLFSRRGARGVRQVEVTGLIGAAFTHRDSRAGDPNLHTHVAIANKVQALDGAWLAIDGRPLHAGMVSVSEVYNTALEAHLGTALGLRFAAEPQRGPAKRAVREVVGVPAGLREAWSSRRAAIEARQAELAVDFQAAHGRPPTPAEAISLAQQATLETRQAKHEPRTLAEQRTTWAAQAREVLGDGGVEAMLHTVITTPAPARSVVSVGWVAATADQMVERMGAARASWTVWHLQAEASRRAREQAISPEHAVALTAELLAAATARCVAVEGWTDPVSDPSVLRRSDGQSMYSTVGSRRFTSTAVINAEQQITRAAALADGRRVDEVDVSLALLASTTAGVTLNAGQVALVREMATGGRRVQLGLAAAGSGKTTALAVLAGAWRESGGTVLGLAPSAVAAGVLGEQIGTSATLAKVAYDLHHHPCEVEAMIGADTLLIVDEAGMADTPTLAAVVSYAISRGASVRLIGDDQQLAAVGAGGVLRDIADTHGAVHLTEVMRFADPAEAAASLALREGRLEALGFYLDQDRIHPGSDETVLRDALAGWTADRVAGSESVMLAGTRDQVATLNRWARDHRLTTEGSAAAGAAVGLSDGNLGSVGDVIVTRMNDRRLAVSATDWVKNGDRWTITQIEDSGGLRAVHRDTGLHIRLPAGYVAEHVELGYAVTIHGAQGITVDTTHTVLSGSETRQQMYVAMSRGRHANHAYVQVVDGGGENAPIHPATLRPVTAVDVVESILARDGSSRSVTTEARHAADPYTRLGQATARYSDAITVAIETLHHDAVAELDEQADQVVDNLTACAAWPTLRAHLLHHAAGGASSPLEVLRAAVEVRELATAADPAAVLTWRIPDPAGDGPLPWLPPIPNTLARHGQWGSYLAARAALVSDTASQVREESAGVRPVWALPGQTLTSWSVGEVEVWRAACGVERADRRPTGPTQLGAAAYRWQQQLNDRIRPAYPVGVWTDLLRDIRDDLPTDAYAPVLAHRLAALHQSGVAVSEQLAAAVADGPLPGEQPAAALWWRLARHLTASNTSTGLAGLPAWEGRLVERLGYTGAAELEASPWWPHLAAAITDAVEAGAPVDALLTPVADISGFDDTCQAMLWRAHHHTHPLDDVEEPPHPDELPPEGIEEIDWSTRRRDLDAAAQLRGRTDPDFTDVELRRGFAAADRWADTPHTPERLAQVTAATALFFEDHLPGSWSQTHFSERFGTDLAGDPRFRLGHAPAGWTTLISELRKQGFSTEEMLAAGVATTTRQGKVIDRFRDRAMVPILHDQVVVGFVGRHHPHADDQQGPKYLNSPASPLFAKREVLYGHHLLTRDATAVIVEGPMDAIAVTLAGHGAFVGVAPLGTALTEEQVLLLDGGKAPIIATDADNAGHVAAEHAFWLLAQHRHDPGRVHLPTGTDPAQLLQTHGPHALHDALQNATPQALQMVSERVALLPTDEAARQVAEITAARPPATWPDTLNLIPEDHTAYLVGRANAWTTTPTLAGETAREQTRAMRRRLEQPAAIRWQRWANRIGLDTQAGEWTALAARLDELHHAGADTNALSSRLAGVPAGVVAATVARHIPGQSVTVDWRPWAAAVNPELVTGAGWGGVEEQLSRLQAVGVNLDALARSMAGRSPVQVAAGLRGVLLRHAAPTAGGGVLVGGARHDRIRGGQDRGDRLRGR